jgi:hypothetical protein
MAAKSSTIAVSRKVKDLLERAKGKKDWDTFLQEMLSEWKGIREAPEGIPSPETEEKTPDHVLGLALDAMRPWSMKITTEGVQLEEVPHVEKELEEEPPKQDPTSSPLPRSIYEGWSLEVKEPESPTKGTTSEVPATTRKTTARRTTKKKSKRR